jgi:hypothetical protein
VAADRRLTSLEHLSRRGVLALALIGISRLASAKVATRLTLPSPLAALQAELANFRYYPDEACAEGDDWWGFWWSLPERGCGDCEDFAAYSYARLRQLGVEDGAVRLMAAEVGEQRLSDGGPAILVHVWIEVDLAGQIWTVSNRQIQLGSWRTGRRMLSRTEVDELVDRSFGPNWPYGVELP